MKKSTGKKLLVVTLFASALLLPLGLATPAKAHDMYGQNYSRYNSWRNYNNNWWMMYMNRHRRHHHVRHTIIRIDRDMFMRFGLNFRYPFVYRHFMGYLEPRNIVLVDQDNNFNQITLVNNLTGPGSTNINTVTLTVPHDVFTTVSNDVNIDQNISVDVNTGSNTVSFNTVVGNVTTGDVNISVN